eukprot:1176787-Amphidinium_carterae.1
MPAAGFANITASSSEARANDYYFPFRPYDTTFPRSPCRHHQLSWCRSHAAIHEVEVGRHIRLRVELSQVTARPR